MGLLIFTHWQSQTNSKQQERVKMSKESKWAKGQDGLLLFTPLKESKWAAVVLPPDRVKLTVNSKKETNSMAKLGKESKWSKSQVGLLLFTSWKGQNGAKVIMSCWFLPPDRVKLIVNSRVKMGCFCLPPDWVKLTVNSKRETKSRVKMGKESKWAKDQDGLLLFTPWKSQNGLLLFTPWQSQTNSEQQERNKQHGQTGQRVKMAQGSRWVSVLYPWKGQNETKVIMSCWFLPPDRVKLIVNSRVKMGCCCLPPDWVKLTVNNKKETNSRVEMGKESKWAKGHNGLLLFTPWKSQNVYPLTQWN